MSMSYSYNGQQNSINTLAIILSQNILRITYYAEHLHVTILLDMILDLM